MVTSLQRSSLDSLGDGEAYLGELPFDVGSGRAECRCDQGASMVARYHYRGDFLVTRVGERTTVDPCKQCHLVQLWYRMGTYSRPDDFG